MNEYNIIAFDMDGTLLNSKKEITAPVMAAVNEAVKQGKQVALSTGRGMGELSLYTKELKNIQYWVCESGAVVYDSWNRKILYRNCFDKKTQTAIAEVAGWEDVDAVLFAMTEGETYIDEWTMQNLDHYNMGQYRPLYEVCARYKSDMEQFVGSNTDGFEKINIMCTSAAEREIIHQRLDSEDVRITYADAEISNLECSPEGTSKATGLQKLCEHLGITADSVMAVGDADNDLDMLGIVGFPIAMGNANEHVKAIARAVVADNDHDGTAEAIQKYLL